MQLLSRTKKGLRRVAFVALLFSAITFAVPINPEVDSESNESTHSLSTSQEPVFHDIVSRSVLQPRGWPFKSNTQATEGDQQPLLSLIKAEVESNHVDPDSSVVNSKIDEVKDAVQTMLNTKTFFKRLREALPGKEYRKLFEAPSIEVSVFREDTDTNPTYHLEEDKDYAVRDEDYQFRVILLFSVSNGKLEQFYVYGLIRAASLTSASASAEGKSVNGMIWVYRVSIEPHSGVRKISRDVWVRFQDGVEPSMSTKKKLSKGFSKALSSFNPSVPLSGEPQAGRESE
ncbi:hypothetical protein FB446DRAFT_91036 [Lentinula raphanica]|nr:hypothetical protein FB446DRAFT_91036 [Lentinula raphanica]